MISWAACRILPVPEAEDGEDAACAYLACARPNGRSSGIFAVEEGRSTSSPATETSTVFVEVRLRSRTSHGAGVETVTGAKRKRIVHAARLYAAAKGLSETPIRFDVVSLDGGGRSSWLVRHDRDAFDGTGR